MLLLHDIGPRLDIHLCELGPHHYYQSIGVTKNLTSINLWLIHLKYILLD